MNPNEHWLRFRWVAGSDRVAHAVPCRSRPATRTACGLEPVDERHTWPERTRCRDCLDSLGFLPLVDTIVEVTA